MKTQIPYALLNGSVTFIGFLIAGFINSKISVVISFILLLISALVLSKLNKRNLEVENVEYIQN